MSRHLADHRAPSEGGRLKHFLRLARGDAPVWRRLHRRQTAIGPANRRVVEFLRIARQNVD